MKESALQPGRQGRAQEGREGQEGRSKTNEKRDRIAVALSTEPSGTFVRVILAQGSVPALYWRSLWLRKNGEKGLIRPSKGLIRPLKGLIIRPFRGLIRPLRAL